MPRLVARAWKILNGWEIDLRHLCWGAPGPTRQPVVRVGPKDQTRQTPAAPGCWRHSPATKASDILNRYDKLLESEGTPPGHLQCMTSHRACQKGWVKNTAALDLRNYRGGVTE